MAQARPQRQRSGRTPAALAYPVCGHQPASRPEALRQREDLAIVWLHQDSPSGPISQHRHCASSPALEQLADFPGSHLPRGGCSGLREFLSAVPDPRDPRGVRHSLTLMRPASVAAVLADARSLAAIGEWAADAPPGVLAVLGVRGDQHTFQGEAAPAAAGSG